jgi:hypothetical protein
VTKDDVTRPRLQAPPEASLHAAEADSGFRRWRRFKGADRQRQEIGSEALALLLGFQPGVFDHALQRFPFGGFHKVLPLAMQPRGHRNRAGVTQT